MHFVESNRRPSARYSSSHKRFDPGKLKELNSFRFYEALSLGVPPILVSSDCALAFSGRVDYRRFCVSVEEDDPGAVDAICAALAIDDQRYAEMCRQARLHYDTWLSPRNYLYLLHQALLGALRRTATAAPPPTLPQ